MIAKLIGLIDSVFEGYVVLNVNGVGYRVFCSTQTLSRLPGTGEAAKLWIETQVREDHIHLFGFFDPAEQHLFNQLTQVQGVGAKVGLAILSALPLNELQMALMTGDAKTLARANGVGPKLAARIATELKGKTAVFAAESALPATAGTAGAAFSPAVSEAVSALVNLGYSRAQAGMAVSKISAENPDAGLSDLIRLSLRDMGRSDGLA